MGIGCKERLARWKLDEDTRSVGKFSPSATKKLGESLGGEETHTAVGDMVTWHSEFDGTA